MSPAFKVGNHVRWNSEAGRVSGVIIKIHTRDTDYKGHTHHCSSDDLQYEIQSDKRDRVCSAMLNTPCAAARRWQFQSNGTLALDLEPKVQVASIWP